MAPQSQMVQKELLNSVQVQLTAAEEALATKQGKIDQMKQDIFQKEKELETISVFQAQVGDTWTVLHYFLQIFLFDPMSTVRMLWLPLFHSLLCVQAEVYSSDFYAERAAREKLHEERERLATQLEYVKKQNTQLQEELDSLCR